MAIFTERLKNALLQEVWIIKPTTASLEFEPGPTRAALMKASEPETSLSVGWIL